MELIPYRYKRWLFILIVISHTYTTTASYNANKHLFNGQCTDRFNLCHHVCIPNPVNLRQFYCTCRTEYYIQDDGFSCKKTPPKDLEMNIEINQGSYDPRPVQSKPGPRKSTNIHLTRQKRYTNSNSKTPRPIPMLPKGKCSSTSCKNGGICQTMKSSSSEDYLIFCLCRLGYDGVACENVTPGVRFPKFTSNGYLAFPEGTLNEEEFRMSLLVKPATRMASTVIAFKNSAAGNHFLLGIEKNKFIFKFATKNSRKEIRHQSQIVSSDSKWYKVEIERKENNGKLFVDNIESNAEAIELPKDPTEKYPQNSDKSEESTSNFICDYCLYLGGHPQLMRMVRKNHVLFGLIESAYTGCMRNLIIDEVDIDMRRMPFYGRAVEGLGIEDCSSGLCDSLKCNNNGECQISADYSPVCHCSIGFVGENCEKVITVKMPSFTGDSYASYLGLRGTSRSENRVLIRFKPLSDTGVLLYQGYSSDKRGDFLSIYIINGHSCVSYDLGSGTISLESKYFLNLGEWHTIRFHRIGRKGTLYVNDEDSISGNSPGHQVQLTIRQNLQLGGIDSWDKVSAFLPVKHGFKGCIQMLYVDNQPVKLIKEIVMSRNLENCNSHTCGNVRKVCWQDGECVPDRNDFVCSCPLGFVEANCQTKIQVSAIRDPSFNGTSYLVYDDPRILKRFSESRFNLSLYLNIRTTQTNRIIIHAICANQPNGDYHFSLKINIRSGIEFVLNNNVETLQSELLNNLPLLSDHKIKMIKEKNTINFFFNDTLVKTINLKYNSLSTFGFSKLFIGGVDLLTSVMLNMPVQSGVMGCLKHITIDTLPIRVADANDGRSVAECGAIVV